MRYPFVLFDAGETLLGPRESFGEVYARALRSLPWEGACDGAALERCLRQMWAEMERVVPRGADRYAHFTGGEGEYWFRFAAGTLERASGRTPDHDLVHRLLERLREEFRDAAVWRVYPDVPPVLAELRDARFRLAVVSNWDSRLPRLLEDLGLAGWFEAVGVSHLEGVEKPDPELFLRVLRRLGGTPERALHVGDLPEADLAGARAAGIAGVLVDRSGRLDASLEALPDLRALPAIARGERELPGSVPAGGDEPELEVWGQVELPVTWSLAEMAAFPRTETELPARAGGAPSEVWSGVSTREILGRLKPKPDAAYVLVHAADGPVAGYSLATFAGAGAVLALEAAGRSAAEDAPIAPRLVVPGGNGPGPVDGVRGLEFLNKAWPVAGMHVERG